MNNIETITSEVVKFRNERDWEQFHNSKDLALTISIEAGELNELFLWKLRGPNNAKGNSTCKFCKNRCWFLLALE